MSRDAEPPDWALPAWDATDAAPRRDPAPAPEREVSAGASSAGPIVPRGTFGLTILAVSDVTRAVREAVRGDDRLRDVWVEGEVGRVTVSSAGHAYFTLKDERSQLQCVWFRDDRMASPYEPQTGLRVVANGRVDVFDANGVYQLYVSAVQPAGFGDLALRFEALKAQLSAEGLFDVARKRPLPERPAVIAVVTSETGAVWHDIRQRPRPTLAAGPGRPVAVPGPGRRRPGQHRPGARLGGSLRGALRARRSTGRCAGGDHPGPRRRLARGPLVVQRRDGRAGDRAPLAAGRVRGRPRDRRHAGGLRRRSPGTDAVRRGRDRGPRPGRAGGAARGRDTAAGGCRPADRGRGPARSLRRTSRPRRAEPGRPAGGVA